MQKIEAIIRPEKLHDVENSLAAAGFVGLNVVHVTGHPAPALRVLNVQLGGEQHVQS